MCHLVTMFQLNVNTHMFENTKLVICLILDKPIWTGNTSFIAEMDSTITLTCSICAKPFPGQFSWYKNGSKISEV